MTWVISIDESGNLGRDSRFFVMAATVVMRQRYLLSVSKIFLSTVTNRSSTILQKWRLEPF